MQSLVRQTTLVLSKPPIIQTPFENYHTIKNKIRTSISTKKNHYSSLTCRSTTQGKQSIIDNNTFSVSESIYHDDQYSIEGLDRECMPKHVAIILDGTRRWSKVNGKVVDYQLFFEANTLFVDQCLKWGIGTATSYIYSLKNLERGHEANDLIFRQLKTYLDDNFETIKRKGIKFWMIGEKSSLPDYLHGTINKVEQGTKNNTKLELMFALCYGGTREISEATKSICKMVKEGMVDPNEVDEDLMEQELWTGPSRAPNVDLLIRTGGRVRVSNYLVWHLAQTELYFCNAYAPEFKGADFVEALRSYQQRERTFGE